MMSACCLLVWRLSPCGGFRALADEESSERLSEAKRRDVVATLAALPLANEGRSSHNVSISTPKQSPIAIEAGRSVA